MTKEEKMTMPQEITNDLGKNIGNKKSDDFEQWMLDRTIENPEILGGERVFKGSRLSVRLISERLNNGLEQEVREDYEYLTERDIKYTKQYC